MLDEVFDVLKQQFDADKNLVTIGRIMAREGDMDSSVPACVLVSLEDNENLSALETDVHRLAVTFRVVARGPHGKYCARVLGNLRRVFGNTVFPGVAVSVIGMTQSGAALARRVDESASEYEGTISFDCWVQPHMATV